MNTIGHDGDIKSLKKNVISLDLMGVSGDVIMWLDWLDLVGFNGDVMGFNWLYVCGLKLIHLIYFKVQISCEVRIFVEKNPMRFYNWGWVKTNSTPVVHPKS